MCDMTHSYVWHDSFICVTWLIHMSLHVIAYSVTWHAMSLLISINHVTRSNEWLASVCDINAHIHMSRVAMSHDMTHVWHDSFICVTGLIYMCDMTHCYVWHGSFICVTHVTHVTAVTDSNSLHTIDTHSQRTTHTWHTQSTRYTIDTHSNHSLYTHTMSVVSVCLSLYTCLSNISIYTQSNASCDT